ncbi:lipopolysaccharide biosynthesis protein [Sinorhizobium fredii]|uniref:lipopolysaccharide biosynthesis protein n=1 Tax=Rhizobium fredii TaxID=380 RepID=UPI003517959D
MELRHQARHGAIWLICSQVMNMGTAAAVTIILANILSVSDFGLLSLSTVCFAIGSMFSTGIFRETIILRQDVDEEARTALFWLSFLVSLLTGFIVLAIAGPASRFLGSPLFEELLWMTAAAIIINGLGAVPGAIRTVNRDFARVGIQTAVVSLAVAPVTVALAATGHGAISVAATGLVYYIVMTLLHWRYANWRPQLHIRVGRIRSVGRTLLILLSQQALDIASFQMDRGIIGSLLGPHQLGLYSMGRRLNDLIMDAVLYPAISVALPLIASIKEDTARLRSAYKQTLSVASVLVVPANFGLLVVADLAICTLFGEKWLDSTPVLRAFACIGLIAAVNSVQRAVIQGGGRQDIWLGIQVVYAATNVAVILAAAPYGLHAIAYAMVAKGFLLSPLGFLAAGRITGLDVWEHLKVVLLPVHAGLVMASVVALARLALPEDMAYASSLAILVAIGASTYLMAMGLFARSQFTHALSLVVPQGLLNRAASITRSHARARCVRQHPHHPRPSLDP